MEMMSKEMAEKLPVTSAVLAPLEQRAVSIQWSNPPKNPMYTLDPEDPNCLWVGHHALIMGSKIIVVDKKSLTKPKIFIYVSLSDAIRHEMLAVDNRAIEMVFHPHEVHDERLKPYKLNEERRLAHNLQNWDKIPTLEEEE